VKVILPRTCRYPTDVNTTSAGGDGGAPAPASAKSASRTAVVAIVVPVAQEYHRAQGEARVVQRGTENSRDYSTSCTLSALQIQTALLETPPPAPLLVLYLCRSCRRLISIPSMRSVCYARCVVSSPSSQSDVCAGFVCCDSFLLGVLALLPRLVGPSRSCSSCACISSSLSPMTSRRGWY
jgi:hypothetical protein